MKGASSIPKHEMNKGGKASEDVLEEMRNEGKMIQQEIECLIYCYTTH